MLRSNTVFIGKRQNGNPMSASMALFQVEEEVKETPSTLLHRKKPVLQS
jgi:hypothetical protein